jgi:hypothetical protein
VVDMAKKDDELVLLIDRNELEKKARRDNKLNDSDAQNFIDSIMTNYFLDNDNINFLEVKIQIVSSRNVKTKLLRINFIMM